MLRKQTIDTFLYRNALVQQLANMFMCGNIHYLRIDSAFDHFSIQNVSHLVQLNFSFGCYFHHLFLHFEFGFNAT